MINPVAQTFFVDPSVYPQGFFVSSIDICFKKTDLLTFLPITLQLRPTVNGFPHSSTIYSFGEVTIPARNVLTTTFPNLTDIDSTNFTRFRFSVPVFLLPGEHAIILSSNSDQYEVFVAQIGNKQIGTDRLISQQPYAGSFFKSQNGSTYTPYQDIDLMFRVNKCVFDTNRTGSIVFNNVKSDTKIYADVVNLGTQDLTFKNTEIDYLIIKTGQLAISDIFLLTLPKILILFIFCKP